MKVLANQLWIQLTLRKFHMLTKVFIISFDHHLPFYDPL